MVYSASIAIAEGSRVDRLPADLLPGAARAVRRARRRRWRSLAFQVPLRLWQQAAPYLFLLGAGLLVLVLMPGRRARGERQPALDLAAISSPCSPPS